MENDDNDDNEEGSVAQFDPEVMNLIKSDVRSIIRMNDDGIRSILFKWGFY